MNSEIIKLYRKTFNTSLIIYYFSFFILVRTASPDGCRKQDFGFSSVVCVCDRTYCDFVPTPSTPEKGKFILYTSSKRGLRLRRFDGHMDSKATGNNTLIVDPEIKYQTIIGFGAAFTDSAGINLSKMDEDIQDMIIRSFYSVNGSNYNMGRIPIAGTDFSVREYSYDESEDDENLKYFSLSQEDYKYKIPFAKKAMNYSPNIYFTACPWSSPSWMKTNDDMLGYGYLKKNLYQVYTNYLIKFLEGYYSEGIKIWSLSTGNEPTNSWFPFLRINTMTWLPSQMSDWVGNYLGPTLKRHPIFNQTKIIGIEDQRYSLPWFLKGIKDSGSQGYRYLDGVSLHWYSDDTVPYFVLDQTHNEYPDKFLIMTEYSIGSRLIDVPKVALGNWERAARLTKKLFENFNHWITGWMEWNLALDRTGGPSWRSNFLDSSIIVEPSNNSFYKQPTYYAMAHWSKFIPRGSQRINWKLNNTLLLAIAFIKDDQIIVIISSPYDQQQNVSIITKSKPNKVINIVLEPFSLNTIIYSKHF